MATIETIEAKRGSFIIALATGRGDDSELTAAGNRMGERNGIRNCEVKIEHLEPTRRTETA